MPLFVQASSLLLASTALALLRPGRVTRDIPWGVRLGARWLAFLLGGATIGTMALLGFAAASELGPVAAAFASVSYALWLITIWRPDDGGGDDDEDEPTDLGPDPGPDDDDALLPWDDFDRARESWREREPVPA